MAINRLHNRPVVAEAKNGRLAPARGTSGVGTAIALMQHRWTKWNCRPLRELGRVTFRFATADKPKLTCVDSQNKWINRMDVTIEWTEQKKCLT